MLVVIVIFLFGAVSHQLYGDSKFHLNVRALGVRYQREHPERFIESNAENSWKGYLTNMWEGTWSDNLIIQAVAEKLDIIIHITKSNPLFAEMNVIEPLQFTKGVQTFHLGHIDKLHYILTVQLETNAYMRI